MDIYILKKAQLTETAHDLDPIKQVILLSAQCHNMKGVPYLPSVKVRLGQLIHRKTFATTNFTQVLLWAAVVEIIRTMKMTGKTFTDPRKTMSWVQTGSHGQARKGQGQLTQP